MKICKLCKRENPDDAMFCQECGTLIINQASGDIYDGNKIIKRNLDITKPGIFKIVNQRTGETYVSFSRNMEIGIENHIDYLKLEGHHNKDLQEDYNNGDRFNFILLEESDSRNEHVLKRMLRYWIDKEDSFNHGYNRNDRGGYEFYEYDLSFSTGGRLKDKP